MLMSTARARQGHRQGRLPRPAGRPAQPHHRRPSRWRCKEAATAGLPRLRAARSWPTPRRWPTALTERGFDLVSGGTDNHLILIDLTSKGIGGKPAAKALDRAGIELNYNTVPFDPRKPFDPSGIRIGTAAVTSRGMGTGDMAASPPGSTRCVGAEAAGDEAAVEKVGAEVREFTRGFAVPGLPG